MELLYKEASPLPGKQRFLLRGIIVLCLSDKLVFVEENGNGLFGELL